MTRRSKSQKRCPCTAIPGNGKPFETATEFADWFFQNRDSMMSYILKAKVPDDDVEDILAITVSELMISNDWQKYDPTKGAKALTWFMKRLKWRITDYYRDLPDPGKMISLSSAHVSEKYSGEEEGGDSSDKGEAADQTINEIEQH